jgi:hypothetical protein
MTHCGRTRHTHAQRGLLREHSGRDDKRGRGASDGPDGFNSDAFKKEVTPKGATLDAIVAGLRSI